MISFPILVFLVSFFALWLSVKAGAFLRTKQSPLDSAEREDFAISLGATLTLLGLIIGFTFSMSLGRYDERRLYEQAEANVIGTEFLRADLLPGEGAARVRELLKKYLRLRIAFYETNDSPLLEPINRATEQLQNELWSAVRAEAIRQPTPMVALVVSGMNEVLDAQGRSQAAFWNRIPGAAWFLMGAIAIFSCLLIGSGARSKGTVLYPVLPLVIAVALLLIADLDSPRGGFIRLHPRNLLSLSASLK